MNALSSKYNKGNSYMLRAFLFLAFVLSQGFSYAQREFDIYLNSSDYDMTLIDGKIHITSSLPLAAYGEDTRKPAFPLFPYKILIPANTTSLQYNVTFNSSLVYSNVNVENNSPAVTSNGEIIGEVHDTIVSVTNPIMGSQTVGLGDYRYSCLTVSPFLYDASNKNLYFVSHIKITVPSFPAVAGTSSIENWPLEFRDVAASLVNSEDLDIFYYDSSWGGDNSGAPLDYLVITSPALAPSFQDLAEWKRRKGYWTEIVTTDSIYNYYSGVDNQQKIKNFLYSNLNRNVKFVLLGGDDTIVPCRYCAFLTTNATTPADMYYSCFSDFNSGDWDANNNGVYGEKSDNIDFNPAFYLSRLPIRTTAQAAGYISKLLQYEMSADTVSTNRILLSGYSQDGYHNTAKNYNNYLYQHYIQPYWSGNKYYLYENEGLLPENNSYAISVTNLANEINRGYNIIHHVSHGSATSWILNNGSYTDSHAYLQTNTTPSVIVTNACSSNAFDQEMCLSEAFLRNTNGGAVAYFGSSREGFSTGSQFNESFMYDAFFFEYLYRGIPYDAPYRFGSVATKAKRAMTDYFYDDINRILQLSINPVGDPEMPIFTDKPASFVTIKGYGFISPKCLINPKQKKITVRSTIDSCRIVLFEDDGNIQVRDNVQEATFSTHYGTHKVTILKHNYTPYLTNVSLIFTPNPPGPVTMNVRKNGSSYEITALRTITEDGDYYGTEGCGEELKDWNLRIVNIITGEAKVNTIVNNYSYVCDTSSWEDGTYAILARDEEYTAQKKILIRNH